MNDVQRPARTVSGPAHDLSLHWERLRESLPADWADAWPAAPMLDGYLCGVLLQPRPVALERWWAALESLAGELHAESSPPSRWSPASRPPVDPSRWDGLRQLATQRHAELNAAIAARQWFDPWVFGMAETDRLAPDAIEDGATDSGHPDIDIDTDPDAGDMPTPLREAVYPWVAGFVEAMAQFQDLLELGDPAASEPQALIAQFLDRDELEDAEALWELIDSFEPPTTLTDAVESLVRACLLLADLTRPLKSPARPPPRPQAGRRGPRMGAGPGFNRGGSRRS
jgi:uncharacterized protein